MEEVPREHRQYVLIDLSGSFGQSHIAEGLINHFWADKFVAHSVAGVSVVQVHPLAVAVMQEMGVNLSHDCPKPQPSAPFDLLITDVEAPTQHLRAREVIQLASHGVATAPVIETFRLIRDNILAELGRLLGPPQNANRLSREFELSAWNIAIASDFEGSAFPVKSSTDGIGWFGKLLALWVALCMVLGTVLGALVPAIPDGLEKATVAQIWIPGVVLVWLMVYPMMLRVEWSVLKQLPRHPVGLLLTTVVNWAVQPFVMYGLAVLFFNVIYSGILDPLQQSQYVAGAVILGGSPCTAMVFVWSGLAQGNPTYTLAQVMLNDLILLALYVPTMMLLLSVSNLALPWDTVFISIALFVVVPAALGILTHIVLSRKCGERSLDKLEVVFKPISSAALLLLIILIFMAQADVIVSRWTHVLLIIVPLLLQIGIIFALTYAAGYILCVDHSIAGPAAFIGSSNFFELAVALSITLYGPQSGAVLVAVVGVLVEVPIMLIEVAIVNRTKGFFLTRLSDEACYCKRIKHPCSKNS